MSIHPTELPANLRYDVFLAAEIYAEGVDRRLALDAVQELLVGAEKMGRNIHAIRVLAHSPRPHTDSEDGGESRLRLVDGTRGVVRVVSFGLWSEPNHPTNTPPKQAPRPSREDPIPPEGYPLNPGKVDDEDPYFNS